MKYDPNTSERSKWYVQPYDKVDEIAAYRDICYDMGKNRGDSDRAMVRSLSMIPYGELLKWGKTARLVFPKIEKAVE